MAGLVPAIHVFFVVSKSKTWLPGTRPGMMATKYAATSHRQFPAPFYMIYIM
jgi:hypothetical protein